MTKHEQAANITAFLCILFGEDAEIAAIMNYSPQYVIEKFERYIETTRVEYPWGMHPALRSGLFRRYVDKWELEIKDE